MGLKLHHVFLSALVGATYLLAASGPAAAKNADIVILFDISGSMSNDITQVRNRLDGFDTAMTSNGIDARYGLVTFGNYGGDEAVIQSMTDFATFTAGGSPFNTMVANGYGIEQGSQAVNVALSGLTFRSDAVVNLVLVTDEDDDSSTAQFNLARSTLGADSTMLFNFIGVPGTGNTNARYGVLASENGGTAFSISSFRSDPAPFFDNFVNTKVQEIINTPVGAVPEPATWALMILAFGFVGASVRRRAASA